MPTGYEGGVQDERNTPGPQGPATRRVVAATLILALAVGAPLSLVLGSASAGGGRLLAVAVAVLVLVGGVAALLHARNRG